MRWVALVRGINVGGKVVPMERLRALFAEHGLEDVRTYIQSGNLVFSATGTAALIARKTAAAFAEEFGIDVPVIVRTASQWKAYLAPPKAFAHEPPNRVALGLSKKAPHKDAPRLLAERAKAGERVELAGDALWVHYPEGMGRTELTPARIDKAVGSPTTARNLNTVRKLAELAGST